MKLIIAGSRTIHPGTNLINDLIEHFVGAENVDEVVSGCADGVDKTGEAWCNKMMSLCGSMAPKLKQFPADWVKHGRAAGPYRNMDMAAYADALLLIWDGQSRGSANMKQCMLNKGKPVYEVILSRTKS